MKRFKNHILCIIWPQKVNASILRRKKNAEWAQKFPKFWKRSYFQKMKSKIFFLFFSFLNLYADSISLSSSILLKNWDFLSKKSVIKCKVPDVIQDWQKEVINKIKRDIPFDQVIYSHKCNEDSKYFYPFEFKGNILNHQLDGPGKLRLTKAAKR